MLLVSRGNGAFHATRGSEAESRHGTSDLRAGRENNNEESTHKSRMGYRLDDARGPVARKDKREGEKAEKKAEVGALCRHWRDYLRSPRRRRASVMSARQASQSLGQGQVTREAEGNAHLWAGW